ncbi:hypothetical protein GGI20_002166 [Coemansia sp. BCRC 34301]|nr:hypothetical protein GGI20_002166 [Coemansia sp. BCRC 34301]
MTVSATDGTLRPGKSSSATAIEPRLRALGMRLKQAAEAPVAADREQLLAQAAELNALASEYKQVAELLVTPPPPLSSNLVSSSSLSMRQASDVVKMPRLGAVFATEACTDGEGEFRAQVAVPPGGLSFIASAAVMQESEDEEEVKMPVPVDGGEGAAETATESVGGFAHPTEGLAGVSSSSSVAQMPVPADHAGADAEQRGLPPSGFDVYGMSGSVWPPSSAPAVAGGDGGRAPLSSSSHPGMFGALPMPYPPLPHHALAMHCGFLPPLMYGVPLPPPPMGSPAPAPSSGAAGAPPPGLGAAAGHSLVGVPSSSGATTSEALLAQQMSEMMMMMAMPGNGESDLYQHGYPMNVPFMYPHMDASSSASVAATGGGGSENTATESVVSGADSLVNRGVVSRFASVQQGSSVGGTEYPGGAHYTWAEHSKQMGAYPSYVHQQQGNHQGGHSQGYRRRGSGSNNSSGSGSANGSNNNNSGNYHHHHQHHHHHHQQQQQQQQQQHQHQSRDRRNNNSSGGGYQRQQQQRWNSNSSNNNSGSGSGQGGYAPPPRHHHRHQQHQGGGQDSSGFSEVSIGTSNTGGYYNKH